MSRSGGPQEYLHVLDRPSQTLNATRLHRVINQWPVLSETKAFVQVDTPWQRTQGGMGIRLSLVKEFRLIGDSDPFWPSPVTSIHSSFRLP